MRAQEPQVNLQPRNPAPGTTTASAELEPTRIRVNSDLVLIPVMVTDNNDRLVTGLEREHFHLWEDKVEQVISHFAAEDLPVSIVLLFDASGSMGNKLKMSRAAVSQFLHDADPEDEFALIQFNDHAQLVQGFTNNIQDIEQRMAFIESRGRTALLDAIMLGLDEMKQAKHQRKAILIISDGGDNSSRYSTRQVKDRVRECDTQVYSIGIMEPLIRRIRSLEESSGAALLDELASQSGGRLFEVNELAELPDIASKIGKALRNQYVLGYVPANARRDGKYHRVQVKIDRPKGLPPLRASFRAGYFAPSN
jgi:VWFA-related protein